MMDLFIGSKLINAEPMERMLYNDLRGWVTPEDECPHDEGYLVEYLDGGKPCHPAYKGYISWSPKDVFENAYKKSGEMTFGDATTLAKRGGKVSREGWNESGMYALIMPGFPDGVPANEVTAAAHGVAVGSIIKVRPYWVLMTAQGDVAMWAPSGSDSLAEDWCIVE